MNKVVARFNDGRLVKGTTADFQPAKDLFHVNPADAVAQATPEKIQTQDLKALFFVKDYAGDSTYAEKKDFDPNQPALGRRIKVTFQDGEVLVGTTTGYQPGRPGFFLVPADKGSNNERCFVVVAATQEVSFL